MNCDSPHVLVVGSGSAGKRHALNLEHLGCRVSCVDPRPDRLSEVAELVSVQAQYQALSEVREDQFEYDGMVIASPPKFHIDQARTGVERGIAVLLEKPVSKDLESALKLDAMIRNHGLATSDRLVLGYTWRWWPALQYLRNLLINDVIGRAHFARIHVSAHLADWHPWEAYQEFFMSSKDLGGGALLDESHWIDQFIWIFGLPERVVGRSVTLVA